jgi:hypothetical protein
MLGSLSPSDYFYLYLDKIKIFVITITTYASFQYQNGFI